MKRLVLLTVFALMGIWASAQVAQTRSTEDTPLQSEVETLDMDVDLDQYSTPDFDMKSKDTPIPPPLYIYPNPTANKVTVNTDNPVVRIEVSNMQGHKLLTVLNEKSAELTSLPAGTYVFRITMGDGSVYTYTVVRN